MNNQWVKILVFSLISFGLGFLICCYCCGRGCHRGGGCGDGERGGMHGGCEHGEMKGDCCKGGGHGGHAHMDSEDEVHALIHGLKESNFQGDTTIKGDGCTVTVSRHGEKMEVKVVISDSLEVEEKTVEVHAH
jgi:hypothetical protein